MAYIEGSQAYLTYAGDTHVESSILDYVPIVREFPNVFYDYFPGIPPDHEIEFVIDLEPDPRTISVAPYRMAPY